MNANKNVFRLHAQLLKSLANPKRLEIIHLLRDHSLSVGEIQAMLDLPQANLSQHLQLLRLQKVVISKKNGKNIYYQLAHQNFIKASDLLRQILLPTPSQKISDLLPIGIDPVCKMKLTPQAVAFSHRHLGKTYYFCASKCLKLFKANPGNYKNPLNL